MIKLEKMIHELLEGRADAAFIRQVESVLVHLAATNREPLSKYAVLDIVEAMPNDQPFTVVFRKKNGDMREMKCLRDRELATERKQGEHPTVITVFDTEADGPRCFKIANVYEIRVDQPAIE